MSKNYLHDRLFSKHRNNSDVFMFLQDGRRITYEEVFSKMASMASALLSLGLEPGDRVAVQIEKSPTALFIYGATVMAGGVFLPLNTAYTLEELSYFLHDSTPAVFFGDVEKADDLSDLAAEIYAKFVKVSSDGALDPEFPMHEGASDNASFDPVERDADDIAAILYTSGTTGRSKGAMLTHRNLASNAEVLAQEWAFTADDRLIHALPVYHTHGLFVATNVTLVAGSSMDFFASFDLPSILNALPKATVLMGVPTFYTRLLSSEELTSDLCSNIRLFVSGSAPLLAETHQQFSTRTGKALLERYGMTETNMISSNPYDGDRLPGTVGFPLPDVALRVADPETGAALPQGEVGVIEVRGPNVFAGYWQMPDKTKAEFRDDGFFITGDLGQIDDDGYLSIVGRQKDLIISGGFNVYPKEVEEVLDALEGIVESAVISAPHPDFGEGVLAVAVLYKNAPQTEDDIIRRLSGKVARFKQPKRVFFKDALPRNAMGKVEKKRLRDEFAGTFEKS
ncbi:malonyl-CoA synthase [Pseudohalocynthiibacter sp. F2068]|uniref:malonate--CoA ligase n=1 Tax=Pseudohalocynthiibacter sp. F2068 TaxID=2926418 RepID=UPI001FF28F9F|nr:malonyl-CoA synthase [Pseudohalocynthiibacter sp. F2068]MCK0104580.1 malonyl-CoA synthase [Pseudohalocynthiibacter sp. F2068]